MAKRPSGDRLQISVRRFDFRKLVLAHGWVFLPPFEWHDEPGHLTRPLRMSDGIHVPVLISAASRNGRSIISIRTGRGTRLAGDDRPLIRSQVRRMLRLEEDFSEFHRACGEDPVLGFVARTHCGGMLRAPSPFEDAVKTICTTNCNWGCTKRMCECLCKIREGAFPGPKDLLMFSPRTLSAVAPVGYRAKTILTTAEEFAEGRLDLDTWAAKGEFNRIRKALGQINGMGSYCVNHILVLLGAYSDIPVDSDVLKYLRKQHFAGKPVSPEEAVMPYDKYGRFRFLAYKFMRMGRRLNYIDK